MKPYISFFFIFLFLISQQLYAGGFIVVSPQNSKWKPCYHCPIPPRPIPPPPPDFTPFPLEVKSEKVSVEINNQAATTHIDQVFYNSTNRMVEGYFMFPIPKGGVIDKFSMYINGEEVEGELLDAKKARKIYEDIVRNLRDPALLEYSEQNLFKARVFPIQPRSEQRIKISYSELLSKESATVEYVYPLNTKKFAAQAVQNISIDVKIFADEAIKTVYCPTHDTDIVQKAKKEARASFEASKTKPDTDFKLYYNTDRKSSVGLSLLSYKERKEDGYFFLTVSPGFEEQNQEIAQKDITFVLDVSGSMSGEKLEKAKESLHFCINNLNEGDCFNIIRFSTEARALFDDLEEVNKESLSEAKEFINDLKAIGGTNIDEALEEALSIKRKADRPYIVVFITDGKPTVGVTEEEKLLSKIKKNNSQNTRIFTFGIGEDINTHLLDKITELSNAYRSYILPNEDIEIKISNFYTKISSPILTDLKLKFDRSISEYQVYPKQLPDLFRGSSVSVLGRYKGDGKAKVTLTGQLNGQSKTFDYQANFVDKEEKHDFIPPVWASRAVGYLLDQIRLHGEDKELVDEVTDLAKKYGIVTPYTSYLIIEDEKEITQVPQQRHPYDLGNLRPRRSRPTSTRGGASRSSSTMPMSKDTYEVVEEEYKALKKKEGKNSIRSSREIQQLNKASNYAQTRQGQSRMNYRDKQGRERNIAGQYRNIQGRAVYQNSDNSWVDSKVAKNQKAKVKRIQFASKGYFELLQNEPLAADFLALGNNVQFYLNDVVYEVFE